MAIIKCPECGRQVSERAPLCPNCGVEIAGKVIRCSDCGEVYFIVDRLCPACHKLNGVPSQRQAAPVAAVVQSVQQRQSVAPEKQNAPVDEAKEPELPKKKGHGALIVSFLFAAIICGAMFYLYSNAQSDKEEQEYELAMKSSDPLLLQAYLAKFAGQNELHANAVQQRLDGIQRGEAEWENVLSADSRSAFLDYVEQHPNSSHRQVALNKIDSLDWISATSSKDDMEQNLFTYVQKHPDGAHASEAKVKLDEIKAERESTTASDADKSMVAAVMKKFFQAVNSHSESSLRATLSPNIQTFNGKGDNCADAAVEYMNKQYQGKVANFNWHIDRESYNIQRQPEADGAASFSVNVTVKKVIDGTGDAKKEDVHTVSAVVGSDGLIRIFSVK